MVKAAAKERKPKKVILTFLAPDAKSVSVAGDFNNWDTTSSPMKKGKNGIWKISLSLPPGTYQYRFFADGEWQNDPECTNLAVNEFGTLNCVAQVE